MNCILTIWSSYPEYYFLINNVSRLLREKYKVHLIYQREFFKKKNYFVKCKNHRIFKSKNFFLNKLYFGYYLFYLLVIALLNKPKFIIIFNHEPIFSVLLIRLFFRGKIIYHNFDYDPKPKTFFKNVLNYIEKKLIKNFDLIIFSNQERKNYFIKKNKVKNKKFIYMYNSLSKKYESQFTRNNSKKYIKIFRIGSIAPGHGLKNLIKSFRYLNSNFILEFCGVIHDYNFYNQLKKIILKYNLKNRINFFSTPSEIFWKKKLFNADIGVALYENINLSHKYMVGASQKINSYLFAGLPIITSHFNDFKKFEKNYSCSKSVNVNNPKEIASGIKELVSKKNYKIKKKNAKDAFEKCFNFEKQSIELIHYLKLKL